MEMRSTNHMSAENLLMNSSLINDNVPDVEKKVEDFKSLFQQLRLPWVNDVLAKLATSTGKQSFLVFKNHKYVNVLTENIAFFFIKYDSAMIMCFDRQEYFVNYSLEQIQNLLPVRQFYRLNRQYLINFNAVKDVEHYFARKLLVNPVIPMKDKLIVAKEKVTEFLRWLDNR